MKNLVEHDELIRETFRLAIQSATHGNHPFGAILVKDGRIILTAENTVITDHDATRHAELNLVSQACRTFDGKTLAESTLYSSTEPCAMCTGAIFWAGIGRIVYGCPAEGLGEVRNSPFVFPSRELLAQARREVEIVGPVLEEEAVRVHHLYWK